MNRKPRNIRELREAGYRPRSVKEEMRTNLIERIKTGQEQFPGIIGFEDSVIPQVENAILAGQDIIFLGERGQAKTRIIRSLVGFLDEEIPIIAGCEINDSPFNPICKSCRDKVAKRGDKVEISWLPRDSRYGEKLATPDTTIADLIGEVDPIRVAEGKYLSDELTIHYGLIPRTNRGIFSINELPDLAERIQVGLFNLMEEKDIQIRGYKIRLPLDVYIVASANPEDYTNRGRIITPLKDRYGSQIRTHYPQKLEQEISIMEQERTVFEDGSYRVLVPPYIKEIVAELTSLARRHPDINQRSGVSVRMSISNYENLVGNALRRAIRLGEDVAVPRVRDLAFLVASTSGKIELETVEDGAEGQLVERLIQNTVLNVFNRHFAIQDFDGFLESFKSSPGIEVSESKASQEYTEITNGFGGLGPGIKNLECDHGPAATASAVEFILEGLHLNKKLNKEKLGLGSQYKGMND